MDSRRKQFNRALKWAGALFVGFVLVTHQVIINGPLIQLDAIVFNADRPKLTSLERLILLRIDNLGLRGVTATILLITAFFIARRFKSWRPLNLSILAVLALNLVVGLAKLGIGRTKPRLNVDLVYAGGLSYPSGHASNAILTWGVLAYILYRYSHPNAWHPYAMGFLAGIFTLGVCVVSAFRNTHWISDLVGGLFIGGALLVMVIAVDRFVPSEKQTR
ncbi:MAG: phosphatase PAP2 family protein [Candidatus Nanopelagicaceae bacterium]|nr:phosphatase PAP2 family protein [Candidatus Nanopelagicaceae bacterium]